MFKVLRDLAITVTIIIVIGAVATMIPVLAAVFTVIVAALFICLIGGIIYSVLHDDSVGPKQDT